MTKAKFVALVKQRIGTDGKRLQISGDMALAPQRYGFKDRAAAQTWMNAVELAQ